MLKNNIDCVTIQKARTIGRRLVREKTLGDMDKKWEETNDKKNKTNNMKETVRFLMGT